MHHRTLLIARQPHCSFLLRNVLVSKRTAFQRKGKRKRNALQENSETVCLISLRLHHLCPVSICLHHDNQKKFLLSLQELLKKCHQCMEIIVSAKDRQAAEANKNASILLEELDQEKSREESKKLAAARKREKKRRKKKEKQEKEKEQKEKEEKKDEAG